MLDNVSICDIVIKVILSGCCTPVMAPSIADGDAESLQGFSPSFPMRIDILEHLARVSPLRVIVACAFHAASTSGDESSAAVPFHEMALELSEPYPVLYR